MGKAEKADKAGKPASGVKTAPVDTYADFDLEDPELPDRIKDRALASAGFPYDEKLKRKGYEEQLLALQLELLKMQTHVEANGLRIVAIFEGRDSSGKGGCISRFLERLNPAMRARLRLQSRPRPSRANGTSSATSSTCRPRATSSSSTAPGTIAPASRR